MRFLLMGAATVATGGGIYTFGMDHSDVVRVVAKPPAQVYDGFHLILGDYSEGMQALTAPSDDGWGGSQNSVEVKVKTETDHLIDYTLLAHNQPFVHINVTFTPVDNGAKTKVTSNVEINAIPRPDGQPGVPISGLGAWGFKQLVKRAVDQIAVSIERGNLQDLSQQLAEMRAKTDTDPNAAKLRREHQTSAAAAPMLDPSAAAVHPVGASAAPMTDVSR